MPSLTAVCIESMPQPTKAVFLKSLTVSKLIGILSFLKVQMTPVVSCVILSDARARGWARC